MNEAVEDRSLYTRMDLADKIAEVMHRRGISKSELADLLGSSKGYITKILKGNANLTIDSIVRVFSAVDSRFDFAISPNSEDEWLVKRVLKNCEESFWEPKEVYELRPVKLEIKTLVDQIVEDLDPSTEYAPGTYRTYSDAG